VTRSTDGAILGAADSAAWRAKTAKTATRLEWSGEADGLTPLVRQAQRGDSAAFERLVETRLDAAYRLAFAILRSEADARDAVQEAFVAAWRQLRGLRDPDRFGSWLDRIVVNACRMAIRRRKTVRVREIHVADPAGFDGTHAGRLTARAPDDAIADADLIRRGLERLSVDQRVVLVLHHALDRPVDEIAEVVGVPVGTVKWRLHAAREALRRAVLEELQ
jgi:RNA polymerase sigma-70 factor (ECF subfamily)